MTEDQIDELTSRIHGGDRPTLELWTIRQTTTAPSGDENVVQALSDLWGLAFHVPGLFPQLEAAKALVELALASGTSYPILTNDGLIYDALSPAERLELVEFIRKTISGADASGAENVLHDFVDDLLGAGPQV